jgi:hypothetical protein
MKMEMRELNVSELEQVSGAWFSFINFFPSLPFLPKVTTDEGGGQGGMNDPTQMFQQILQQVTQG